MGAASSFHPSAAVTTTKLGPGNRPQGLELWERGSFQEETRFRIPQSIGGCMMRDERLMMNHFLHILCRLPTSLDLSHAFDGGGNEVGAVSLFHPFAVAT